MFKNEIVKNKAEQKGFLAEFKGKDILVTGGTGSIGSEIVRQLISFGPRKIRVFARSEYAHHKFRREMGPEQDHSVRFIIGDIRDKDRLKLAMENVDIVFHAAAMKHVDICDNDPFEAVATNIIGTQNVINASRELNVGKVIAISTDKAVNPEGVLGVSKLMAEKLILNSYYYRGHKKTQYTCVRFGNVLGSSGSILPTFKNQIIKNGYITVTDPKMTRFVMTIPQAVKLVLRAAVLTKGQEIFVLKMPAVKLGDLADCAIRHYSDVFGKNPADIKRKIIGLRAGEKKHEQLLANHEIDKVFETEDMYILTPREDVWGYFHKSGYLGRPQKATRGFSSEFAKKLKPKEILKLLKETDSDLNIV
ncbi:MAG: SDR family NAD(P)-dependent oxidoreductase [Candidatus Niyogibacteria bacterium]|nr:MAG: SDR family NAD(P)-dependent oxidoreductase [Candidatus Niyogibacteria bacterium]